ncbi:hypothetical protein GCM10009841_13660 [Microlunatus panaciterrae]|uniref:ANTAR domain-containing protein n=1 Tax=Microlunatus panaciterrae TaxID=400768 RepID=A0ABS2RLP8_9ACTN|nr:hypothetical protein [Microlunatus panaciterrae]MBM7799926.1 hypothetical protein [Microlunatus panaciterrae]
MRTTDPDNIRELLESMGRPVPEPDVLQQIIDAILNSGLTATTLASHVAVLQKIANMVHVELSVVKAIADAVLGGLRSSA